MRFDPEKHHRRSIRIKGYDYSQPGAYFVTICTRDRECLLGSVLRLNEFGEIARRCWEEIPGHFPSVELDAFVVMPNHIHAIMVVPGRGTACRAPTTEQFGRPIAGSIPTIVRAYKSAVMVRDGAAGRCRGSGVSPGFLLLPQDRRSASGGMGAGGLKQRHETASEDSQWSQGSTATAAGSLPQLRLAPSQLEDHRIAGIRTGNSSLISYALPREGSTRLQHRSEGPQSAEGPGTHA